MIINLELLEKHHACDEGVEYFKENYTEIELNKLLSELMHLNKFSWCNWIISKLLNRENKIRYAIFSAELVLHLFEKEFPSDKRPRQAIEAAKNYLINKNIDAAYAAARSAYAATRAAASATTSTPASHKAASAAAYSAAAACDSSSTSYAASASSAADAADNAAACDDSLKPKIINYGLELINEQQEKV